MKVNKQKTNIFKNFCAGIKYISKLDKSYIILNIIQLFLIPLQTYSFSFILLKTMRVLESDNPELIILVKEIVPIISVCLICAIINVIISEILQSKDEILVDLLINDLSLKTLEMDYEKLERKQAQDELEIAMRAMYLSNGFMGIITKGFNFLRNLILLIIGSGIILSVNFYLIFIVIILAILKLILNSKKNKNEKKIRDENVTLTRKNAYTNNISQNLGLGKDLRVYNMNEFINEERDSVISKLLKSIGKQYRMRTLYEFIIKVLEIIDLGCLYGFLIYEVLFNNMLISSFSFMISNVSTVIWSINNLTNVFGNIYYSSLNKEKKLLL